MNPGRVRAGWARRRAREELASRSIIIPPVDAERIVCSLARVVVFEHETLEGFTAYDCEADLHIVHVNAAQAHNGRSRFTWAHEAGHIVLGHLRDFDSSQLREASLHILDREADIFATELLMPRIWMEKFVPIPCDVRSMGKLKELFGVSWEAFIGRLDELGMQSSEKSRRALEEYAANRERRQLESLWLRSRAR